MASNELDRRLINYLRFHRRAAGLNQAELGNALGYRDEETVGRHERSYASPPLEIAIGYEIVFRVPVGVLFAGLRAEVELRIEERLARLEMELGEQSAEDAKARATAQKLMWLIERRNPEYRPHQ